MAPNDISVTITRIEMNFRVLMDNKEKNLLEYKVRVHKIAVTVKFLFLGLVYAS
jgi:hypothetical protein